MKKTVALIICILFVLLTATPCFATEPPFFDTDSVLTVNTYAEIPVNAKAYVLMDSNTGTLLAAKNEEMQLYPASVTKIMTILLVAEAIQAGKLSFDETLVCSETAAAKGGSQIWLEPGEEMSVRDLMKAACVYSANDACTLLGEAVAGSEEAFVQMMNARAAELHMVNTHFDNCTGLDDDTTSHLTTAYDVALMSRALIAVDFIRDFTSIWMDTLRGGKTQLVNTNRLIRFYNGITGLKTGTTAKAGCCVSATAQRDGLGLIAVVLGAENSSDRFNGAKALLDYGFANYEIFTPVFDPAGAEPVKVNHGAAPEAPVTAELAGDILLSKGSGGGITQKNELLPEIDAPVEKGQKLGTVKFYAGDAEIARYDIVSAVDVPKLTFIKALQRIFMSLRRA